MEMDNALSTTNAKLEVSPLKAISEYYESVSRGIYKNSAPLPEWDQVPHSSSQNLIQTLICQDQQRAKNKSKEEAFRENKIKLNKQWEEIKTLEEALKDAFCKTEEKIDELKICEFMSGSSATEKNETLEQETDQLCKQESFFTNETIKVNEAITKMEADIKANSSYMEFALLVAHEYHGFYNDGARSVLQHFERLKNAHKEIAINQENLLIKMKRLRKETQEFTSRTLAQLDLLEGDIHEINTQLLAHEAENKAQDKIVWKQKESKRMLTGESKRMKDSLKCMYEQMWKRYNGISSSPPVKTIQEQVEFIQITMSALENLSQHLKVAKPKLNESVSPEASALSK